MFELLQENGLGDFYRLADGAGVRVSESASPNRFAFLDEPAIRDRLIDFSDGSTARVSFHVPTIHCVACVWLLENLYKLSPGIGKSVVDFEKRRVSITFEPETISLSGLAALLSSIGYEPTLRLDSLDQSQPKTFATSLYIKLGIAGFAFGNIMLFSICLYSGMDRFSAPLFKPLFGWVSLVLALPVLIYSAAHYWQSAWLGLRQRILTIDFPIALGLVALFTQSVYEVVRGQGIGYLDSLTGLVFFLLIGRAFQDKTYQRLSFDRDYKSFFPLAVKRRDESGERTVPVSDLAVGDQVMLRHGELIPADARILQGNALIDYSFVTGESEPVQRSEGDTVYAGGQQVGGALDLEIIKPVSQSYLTSLWSHETFAKSRDQHLNNLLNRFSRVFTLVVVVVALAAGVWWWTVDPGRAVRAFTAVLIVACPCALALSAPFALGTAQRLLARLNVFARNPNVIETMAGVNSIVFDKTGTLTTSAEGFAEFVGEPLTCEERRWIKSVAAGSTHPLSTRIAASLGDVESVQPEIFEEVVGMGICVRVEGNEIRLGSEAWLQAGQVKGGASFQPVSKNTEDRQKPCSTTAGSHIHVAVDGVYRGAFTLSNALRPGVDEMMTVLSRSSELVLLSGDKGREQEKFQTLLGSQASLRFEQSPTEKLSAIEEFQRTGRSVMMVGDGLNDAGALRQCDVGVAVVEKVGTFSPASDIIMEARNVPALADILKFSKRAVTVVWICIGLSLLYNVVGLVFAASGLLSPIVCAILMPLSSITVVSFACGAVSWMARRSGLSASIQK